MAALLFCALTTIVWRSKAGGEYLSLGWNKGHLQMALHAIAYDFKQADTKNPFAAIGNLFTTKTTIAADPSDEPARDIPVLLYHGIVANPDRFSMTPETFWDQMKSLKDDGWRTITLKEFEDFIAGGPAPKGKVFLLTFDDGRTDSYTGADPVLRSLGFTALMFVSSYHTVDDPTNNFESYYLSLPALKEMVASKRWEIGSHAVQYKTSNESVPIDADGTLGVLLSNKMWLSSENRLETDDEYKTRIANELSLSKQRISEALGVSVTSFAYPNGDYGQFSKNNLELAQSWITQNIATNYAVAFRQIAAKDNAFTSNFPGQDPYHLVRIESGTSWSGTQLVEYLDQSHTKALPYADDFSNNNGWKYTWGDFAIDQKVATLRAGPTTTGGMVILDGSAPWTDYSYKVTGGAAQGSAVTLMVRYKNSSNYAACTFSNGDFRLYQYLNGAKVLVNENRIRGAIPIEGAELGASVQGQNVKCYAGNKVVAAGRINSVLDRGGIALGVWDDHVGTASFHFNSLAVDNF